MGAEHLRALCVFFFLLFGAIWPREGIVTSFLLQGSRGLG